MSYYDGESTEYYVFHDFEHTPALSPLDQWPLHITIASWFVLANTEYDDVIETVGRVAKSCKPFAVEAGDRDWYGPDFDIPVTRIIDTYGQLKTLHTTLIEDLGAIGCEFIDYTYALEAYSAHTSDTPELSLKPGVHAIDRLIVGSRQIVQGNKSKFIDAVIKLG